MLPDHEATRARIEQPTKTDKRQLHFTTPRIAYRYTTACVDRETPSGLSGVLTNAHQTQETTPPIRTPRVYNLAGSCISTINIKTAVDQEDSVAFGCSGYNADEL